MINKLPDALFKSVIVADFFSQNGHGGAAAITAMNSTELHSCPIKHVFVMQGVTFDGGQDFATSPEPKSFVQAAHALCMASCPPMSAERFTDWRREINAVLKRAASKANRQEEEDESSPIIRRSSSSSSASSSSSSSSSPSSTESDVSPSASTVTRSMTGVSVPRASDWDVRRENH